MVSFAHYFSLHRVKDVSQYKSTELFVKALQKYGTVELLFRHKHEFFDQTDFGESGIQFIYDNLRPLNGEEVARIEKEYLPPYNLLRLMTNVSRVRYPQISNLPDDLLLAQIADIWVRFFQEKKPDLFVGSLMDDYAGIIGLEVAKRMGINTVLIFSTGVVSGQFILCGPGYLPVFYRDYSDREIREAYKKVVENLTTPKVLNPVIGKIFGKYYELASPRNLVLLLTAFFKSVKWYYFDAPKIERKMWFSPFELISRQTKYFIRSKISSLIFSEKPQNGEKYVFFPLHFMNDAAIVQAVPFADQIGMVRELAKVLPHGVKLYIKPHPHWRCADMGISDVLSLRKIPNARLIDANVNARELVRCSEFVVIINSSVGYESLALKKKICSLGNFYPPDIIPRLINPRDILGIWNQDIDWKKVEEFLGKIYLHGVNSDEDNFAVGNFNEDVSANLAKAVYEYYQTVPGKK